MIQPYSFNMSRFNQNDARRIISIPEIGAYAVTHSYMKETHIIKDLIEFTDGNSCSFSPILDKNYRIVRHEEVYDHSFPLVELFFIALPWWEQAYLALRPNPLD